MLSQHQSAEYRFTVTDSDMVSFQDLSGDYSYVHTDSEFAHERGFGGPIVYGGIVVAKLSHMVGQILPGQQGVSVSWSIMFRNPLYVGEEAVLRFEIESVSRSVGLIHGRFRVLAEGRLIAEGKTQSIVPVQLLEMPSGH